MVSMQRWFVVVAGSCLLATACKGQAPAVEATPKATTESGATAKPATTAGEKTAPVELAEPKPTPVPGKVLTSDEFHFKVTFPSGLALPEVARQDVPTEAGSVKTHTWMAERGNAAFAVTVSEYPAKIIEGTDLKKLLTGARDGSLGGMGATATTSKDISIEGRTGIRATFKGSVEGTTMWGQALWVAYPPYVLAVLVATDSEAEANSAGTTAFLDSLTLVGLSNGRAVTSADGGYTINFPESYPEPTASDNPFELPTHEKMVFKLQMSTTSKGAVGIGHAQLPAGPIDTKAALDGGRDGMLKNLASLKLEREEEFTFSDTPARRIWVSGTVEGNSVHGRMELLLIDHRIFLIEALAPSEDQLKADQMEAFFKSFKLTDAKPTP